MPKIISAALVKAKEKVKKLQVRLKKAEAELNKAIAKADKPAPSGRGKKAKKVVVARKKSRIGRPKKIIRDDMD